MESQRGSFKMREFIACFFVMILVPVTVYRGVDFFVKPEQKVQELLYKWSAEENDRKLVDDWKKNWATVFLRTSLIVGLVVMAIGVVTHVASLGTSLILGGCISIIDAYVINWQYLSDVTIFVSLLIAVLGLIGALWWFSRKKKA
jgi:hypothetical protein